MALHRDARSASVGAVLRLQGGFTARRALPLHSYLLEIGEGERSFRLPGRSILRAAALRSRVPIYTRLRGYKFILKSVNTLQQLAVSRGVALFACAPKAALGPPR
jgi:hypothetical protein